MEFDKNEKASILINRFRSLTQHAETIAFPKAKNSVFLPVNMDRWHPIRRFLYKASVPYLYAFEKNNESLVYFFLTIFGFVMSFSTLMIAERVAKAIPTGWNQYQFILLYVFMFFSVYSIVNL